MKVEIQVLNLPELQPLECGELLVSLREAVVAHLEREGFPFGSGYSVWTFYDD